MGESGSAGRELDVMVDQAVQQGMLDEQFLQLRSLQVRGCVDCFYNVHGLCPDWLGCVWNSTGNADYGLTAVSFL